MTDLILRWLYVSFLALNWLILPIGEILIRRCRNIDRAARSGPRRKQDWTPREDPALWRGNG